MSRRRAQLMPEEIDHARMQERLRQARRRERAKRGCVMVLLPGDVADELGDDNGNVRSRAIEILRKHLRSVERDEA